MRPAIARVAACLLATGITAAGSLQDSKHNLSVGGPGAVTATAETRLCVFCHTPHNASPAVPLWNQQTSTAAYSTYGSTTLSVISPVDQPGGDSKLCLSCHDGTVALGQTISEGLIPLANTGPGGTMPPGGSDLGIDLTDDHPVSFAINPANPEVMDPPPGGPVGLDPAGLVQCTSCHDPHVEDIDPVTRRFLVTVNQASALCLTCHRPDFWGTNPSSHQSSTATYTAAQGAHTGYTTVMDNGCASCHRSHSGSEPQRLLKLVEEATCEARHDGSVAGLDVVSVFNTKPFVHPTFETTPSVHDAAESPTNPATPLPEISPGAARHAECADCHDPHASFSMAAVPPDVPGALSGAWGIDTAGQEVDPATFGYQICYKCHADSANKPQESGLPYPPYTQRKIVQFNVRLEFDAANPSHHAVVAPGANNDVPSLLAPYTTASVISCVDCHNSDSAPGGGPDGPHGSAFDHLLERNLAMGSNNSGDTTFLYAMCFKCHSESILRSDNTFGKHKKHFEGEGASCTVCHDPHGISATQGNASENSHLINFDTDIVLPTSGGQLRFEDLGNRTGRCFLICHNKNHDPKSY